MAIRSYHYWIKTQDENGKPYLVYACSAKEGEERARQRGMELLGSTDFELKRLPTSDISTASSMIRGQRLEQTQDLHKANRRIGHNRSLRFLKKNRKTDNLDWI